MMKKDEETENCITEVNHTSVLRSAIAKESVCSPFCIHSLEYRMSEYKKERKIWCQLFKLLYDFLQKGDYGVKTYWIHVVT